MSSKDRNVPRFATPYYGPNPTKDPLQMTIEENEQAYLAFQIANKDKISTHLEAMVKPKEWSQDRKEQEVKKWLNSNGNIDIQHVFGKLLQDEDTFYRAINTFIGTPAPRPVGGKTLSFYAENPKNLVDPDTIMYYTWQYPLAAATYEWYSINDSTTTLFNRNFNNKYVGFSISNEALKGNLSDFEKGAEKIVKNVNDTLKTGRKIAKDIVKGGKNLTEPSSLIPLVIGVIGVLIFMSLH